MVLRPYVVVHATSVSRARENIYREDPSGVWGLRPTYRVDGGGMESTTLGTRSGPSQEDI